MAEKIYLIDGSGYIFRAFYAIRPLTTRAGFPTNALLGFIKMMRRLITEVKPVHMAVAFDVGRETFRMGLYADYKANRVACPDELKQQMPFFRDFVRALGIQVLEQKGYEADDIIGTLAARLSAHGREVVVVSGDKDLTQLVCHNVSVFDPMYDKHYREPEVIEKFGVKPCQVVELLGLMGDSSDNVPGVDGVGPKTAAQLIQKYGSVEGVLSSVAEIRADCAIRNRAKIADQIEKESEKLKLSRKLVEIKLDTPMELRLNCEPVKASDISDEALCEVLKRSDPEWTHLKELIAKFEFASLFEDFDLNVSKIEEGITEQEKENTPLGASYQSVMADRFDWFLGELKQQKSFAFDLETTSLDPLCAEIVGLSFCWNTGKAFYIPVGHESGEGQVEFSRVLDTIGPILSDGTVKKSGQNLKYDIKVLARKGIVVDGVDFDSMVAAWLLNPDRGTYNLTVLASEFLNLPTIEFDQVTKGSYDFSKSSIPDATRYSCQDAHYVWLLKEKLARKLAEAGLEKVAEIEFPLVAVLARMEMHGIGLDLELLSRMSEEFRRDLDRLQCEIYKVSGCEFNINSPKQLAEVLFEKLKIPTKGLKKTKTGFSTDQSVLEKLSTQHELPRLLLEYRSLHKLKSTYIDALPAQISCTGRLHTRLNQCSTGTGRLSSSEPNLQNIPVQGEAGARIRSAFVAAPGKVLISADYSQIELRLLAHISSDQEMTKAFIEDIDIHAQTARQLLHVSSPSSEERRLGKTINFGIVYGMGGYRLARELGIPVSAANSYIESYFRTYSGVRAFFDGEEKRATEKGEVRTLCGRRRVLSDIDATGRDQGFVLRAALNAPVQGSAADIIKLAMVKLDARIRKEKLPIDMILQIHDELLFECENSFKDEALAIVRREMEGAYEMAVPLKVDAGAGANWQEAK